MNKLMSGGFFIDLNEKNELFYSDFNCYLNFRFTLKVIVTFLGY